RAPSRPSERAVARPMPEPPPVTIATCPSRIPLWKMLLMRPFTLVDFSRRPGADRLPRELVRPLVQGDACVAGDVDEADGAAAERLLRLGDQLDVRLGLPACGEHTDRVAAVGVDDERRSIRRNDADCAEDRGELGHVVRARAEELVPFGPGAIG